LFDGWHETCVITREFNSSRRSTMTIRNAILALLPAAALMAGCGAGDAVFSGIGNSGNHLYTNSVKALAEELARSEAVPQITDASLKRIFSTLSRRAEEGDVEAALVIFRVAASQRDD
jgi:hypothetical protein